MENEELLQIAEDKAKDLLHTAEKKATSLLDKNAETRVTYEDWYQANLHQKERIENLNKQIAEFKAQQPAMMEKLLQQYVNGKIDKIDYVLQEYIKDDMEHKARESEETKKWRGEFEPYLKGIVNISAGSKILLYIVVSIAAFFGALLSIKAFFK